MKSTHQNRKDPLQESIGVYKEIIETALRNPFYTRKMSQDEDMPLWLQQLAERLVDSRLGAPIVRTIQNCVDWPHLSRRWNKSSQYSDSVPDWFKTFTELFGKRRKFQ